MEILIGSDHRGFDLKKKIIENTKYSMLDLGCYDNNEIDFPDIVFDMLDKWTEDSMGILICKTGIGMSICANRFSHIRAAICTTILDVISARSHNNCNVMILGASNKNDDVFEMIKMFINTKFDSKSKYNRRVEKMSKN